MEKVTQPDQNCRPENPNTELYIGTKVVKAEAMTETDFYKNVKNQDISDRETYGDGYMVTYESFLILNYVV